MQAALTVPAQTSVARVKKTAYRQPQSGEWTYSDYLRLPDDGLRYEIIDGVLYMANAPDYDHQFTVSKLDRLLGGYVDARQSGVVLVAPFEIHLPGIARPVQPDVFFIAAERQPRPGDKIFEGAPDLIVEVISPGSVRLDRAVKFSAYERAGVREYWLADPHTRFVDIYTLSADKQEYTLHGQFSPGEQVHSIVFAELTLAVDSLFLPSP
ncbi:MAG: Uma2 family endonuclease [Gammaproteobacteria bacterium]|nr:Uma2 family endonuclease [Gammaproteobacteria bacterium]